MADTLHSCQHQWRQRQQHQAVWLLYLVLYKVDHPHTVSWHDVTTCVEGHCSLTGRSLCVCMYCGESPAATQRANHSHTLKRGRHLSPHARARAPASKIAPRVVEVCYFPAFEHCRQKMKKKAKLCAGARNCKGKRSVIITESHENTTKLHKFVVFLLFEVTLKKLIKVAVPSFLNRRPPPHCKVL